MCGSTAAQGRCGGRSLCYQGGKEADVPPLALNQMRARQGVQGSWGTQTGLLKGCLTRAGWLCCCSTAAPTVLPRWPSGLPGHRSGRRKGARPGEPQNEGITSGCNSCKKQSSLPGTNEFDCLLRPTAGWRSTTTISQQRAACRRLCSTAVTWGPRCASASCGARHTVASGAPACLPACERHCMLF